MAPDWTLKPTPIPYADLSNPQTLPLYSYAENNPLSFSDPDGHWPGDGLFRNWMAEHARSLGIGALKYLHNSSVSVAMHIPGAGDATGATDITGRPNWEHPSNTTEEIGYYGAPIVMAGISVLIGADFPAVELEPTPIIGSLEAGEGEPLVTVGRWMSPQELQAMTNSGLVQESLSNGVTSVTMPPNPAAYLNAPDGDIFAQFDVPQSAIGAWDGAWAKIYGPNSIFGPNLGIMEMPPATNIQIQNIPISDDFCEGDILDIDI